MITNVRTNNREKEYPKSVRAADVALLTMLGMAQGLNADIKADDARRGLVDTNNTRGP